MAFYTDSGAAWDGRDGHNRLNYELRAAGIEARLGKDAERWYMCADQLFIDNSALLSKKVRDPIEEALEDVRGILYNSSEDVEMVPEERFNDVYGRMRDVWAKLMDALHHAALLYPRKSDPRYAVAEGLE